MRSIRLLVMGLLILVGTPALWAANALIVHDGTPGIEADALGNLTTHLVGKGFTVTPNVGVPGGSLATYQQIWDIRFNNTTPLTPADNTAYTTFLTGGGSLFVMGENAGFVTRNSSIVAFVTALGGGTPTFTTPANTQTVIAPFTGPTPLTTITFLAGGGFSFPPGTGRYVTRADPSGIGTAIVFSPGTLSGAPTGTLIVVFDVNFLQAGADLNSQTLTDNMISYLAAPVALPPPTLIPTLGFWQLMLLVACLAVAGAWLIRRQL